MSSPLIDVPCTQCRRLHRRLLTRAENAEASVHVAKIRESFFQLEEMVAYLVKVAKELMSKQEELKTFVFCAPDDVVVEPTLRTEWMDFVQRQTDLQQGLYRPPERGQILPTLQTGGDPVLIELRQSIMFRSPRDLERWAAADPSNLHHRLCQVKAWWRFISSVLVICASTRVAPHELGCHHKPPDYDCFCCRITEEANDRLKNFFAAKDMSTLLLNRGGASHESFSIFAGIYEADFLAQIHYYRLFHASDSVLRCNCVAVNASVDDVESGLPDIYRLNRFPPDPLPFHQWVDGLLDAMFISNTECDWNCMEQKRRGHRPNCPIIAAGRHVHACSNVECREVLDGGAARMCAECERDDSRTCAFYCSKLCQKADWPRHRLFHGLIRPDRLPSIHISVPLDHFT